MKIEIKLFASLSKYSDSPMIQDDNYLDVPENTTIRNIVNMLKIPNNSIKLIFLNSVHASLESEVKEGDRVGLFPPIGGG